MKEIARTTQLAQTHFQQIYQKDLRTVKEDWLLLLESASEESRHDVSKKTTAKNHTMCVRARFQTKRQTHDTIDTRLDQSVISHRSSVTSPV